MKVKNESAPIQQIRDLLRKQNGVLFTSDISARGIPRTYLSILEKKGEIQRIERGVYSAVDAIPDEMAGLQARYKNAVFSHETALFLWGLTDRTPLLYSVTVPAGYNASLLKFSGTKVYFIRRDLHSLGLTVLKSPHGNDIKTYNLERTICDVLRSRNQMDIQLVNEALKRYVKRNDRDLNLLYTYAKQFRIQKIAREYIEILNCVLFV